VIGLGHIIAFNSRIHN